MIIMIRNIIICLVLFVTIMYIIFKFDKYRDYINFLEKRLDYKEAECDALQRIIEIYERGDK